MNFKKPKNSLIINIKNDSLMFCVGYFDYTNVYIDKLFKVNTNFNVYEDGLIKDEKALSKLIVDTLKEYKVKEKNAYLYVLSPDSIRTKITVPYIKNEIDFNDLVHTEISQLLPVELDKYIIKHKIINEDNIDNIASVTINCVLMNKEIINSYKRVLKLSKLKPVALDLNSSCIENLMKFLIMSNSNNAAIINKEIENTITAFIEINGEYCSISIFKSGIIDFNRIIKIIDIDKELYLLSNFLNKEEDKNNEELYAFSNKLLNEIYLFLEYYSTSNEENVINEIFIYGDYCNTYGIRECAESIFNIPVNNITMIKGINYKDDNNIGEYVNTIGGLIRW